MTKPSLLEEFKLNRQEFLELAKVYQDVLLDRLKTSLMHPDTIKKIIDESASFILFIGNTFDENQKKLNNVNIANNESTKKTTNKTNN